MSKINVSRVILGGLAAGLVCNIFDGVLNAVVLTDQWGAVQKALGHSALFSVNQVILFNVLGFATGILAVWIYAAIRSRFQPGPATAVRAGLATWALFNLLPNLFLITTGVLPASLLGAVIGLGIIEYPVATLVGAAIYKELGEERAAAARA